MVARVLKEQPGLIPSGVVGYLNEVGYDTAFYRADPDQVTAFRHLVKDERLRVVLNYIKRKPGYKRQKPSGLGPKQRVTDQVFLPDVADPSCSFYDVGPFEWIASKQEGELVWEVVSPGQVRGHLTFPFKSLSEVMWALLRLAVAQKRAFQVEVPQRAPRETFDVVLMPVGDRRADVYATTPEGALEIEGVPPNTALLFRKDTDIPGVGRLSEYREGPGKDPMYGLTVWSPFYAIEFSTPGFERRPRIIVGV